MTSSSLSGTASQNAAIAKITEQPELSERRSNFDLARGNQFATTAARDLQFGQTQMEPKAGGKHRVLPGTEADSGNQVEPEIRQPGPELPDESELGLHFLDQADSTVVAEVDFFKMVGIVELLGIRLADVSDE